MSIATCFYAKQDFQSTDSENIDTANSSGLLSPCEPEEEIPTICLGFRIPASGSNPKLHFSWKGETMSHLSRSCGRNLLRPTLLIAASLALASSAPSQTARNRASGPTE